jgi:hypothetical protein
MRIRIARYAGPVNATFIAIESKHGNLDRNYSGERRTDPPKGIEVDVDRVADALPYPA